MKKIHAGMLCPPRGTPGTADHSDISSIPPFSKRSGREKKEKTMSAPVPGCWPGRTASCQPERLTDTRAYEKKPSMLFAVVIFLSVVVLGVIAALRFTKGIIPLRTYESRELPGFPGPAGLIHRLDGAEKRQRKLEKARFPGVDENGFISLPPAWEGKVTAGRLACVAHTWAMSSLGPGRPGGGKSPQNRLCARHDDSFFHSSYPAGNADGRTVEIPDRAGHRLACWPFHFLRPSLPVPRMESGGNSQIRAKGSRAVAVRLRTPWLWNNA